LVLELRFPPFNGSLAYDPSLNVPRARTEATATEQKAATPPAVCRAGRVSVIGAAVAVGLWHWRLRKKAKTTGQH
jgi:hypothetical protein